MNIRNYNIYFNTHTISGIIVSVLLFVIFFAGSFSFFKKEISAWQNNTSYYNKQVQYGKFDSLLDSISQGYNLRGRNIVFYLQQGGMKSYVDISASQDSILNRINLSQINPSETKKKPERSRRRGKSDSKYFSYDMVANKTGDYSSNYDMGEFLYRLHFLAQMNQIPIRLGFAPFGYFVAGLVSFLFLFALITGLLLHWEKIVSNFFVFRPFNKWKTVWTDMHTVLGTIGFPYQLIFALTGLTLIINTVLIGPFSRVLYEGKSEKLYEELGYSRSFDLPYSYSQLNHDFKLEKYLLEVRQKWPENHLRRISIKNYADRNMHVIVETEPTYKKAFAGSGVLAVMVGDGKVLMEKSPVHQATYIDQVRSLIYRLHFGDFAGYPVKAIYFILGIMGCLVIISGILIWLVARDKNNVAPRKRKFNFWTANIFMAICLTMFPVTAITFIAIKLAPHVDQAYIYRTYFNIWWILALYYSIRKNINRTNRETILLGSIAGLLIPIANGVKTGSWFWSNFIQGKIDIFMVDFLWLWLGVIGLVAFNRIKNNHKEKVPQYPGNERKGLTKHS